MRKIILILAIAILGSPIAILASQYGTIKGKVTDEKGDPANGASVKIVQTGKGMKVKKDGTYLLSGITAGEYDVEAKIVGKKEVRKRVTIVADETIVENFQFVDEQAAKGETVKVIHERLDNKQINKDRVGSGTVLTNKDLVATSREGMSFIGLTAGVFNESSGFIMRGNRPNESQIRINGMNVSNTFTGGFGLGGMTYTATTSNYATEQTSVVTGGLPAEYGGVLGGVVNSTIRKGSKDAYEGYIRYKTDFEPLYGSQKNGLKIIQNGSENQLINNDDGKKLQASGEQRFEFGIGGPIPGLNNCTFFFSGWNLYEKNRSATYEVYDPLGNNLGLKPHDQSWVKNISGRLFFEFADFSIDIGGSFGLQNFEALDDSWYWATEQGYKVGTKELNGVPTYQAKERVWNTLMATAYVRLRHTLTPATYYELTISNTTNNDDVSKCKTYGDPDFLKGFDIWYPQDNYSSYYNGVGDSLGIGKNHIIDEYELLYRADSSKDFYYHAQLPQANPLTGYVEGRANATSTNNPYGLSGLAYNSGNTGVFQFRRSNYWQVDGFLESNYNGDEETPSHSFKTGFEVQLYQLSLHSNSLPWDGNPYYDVYSSDWGGDLYTESASAKEKTSKPFKPMRAAFYVQDKISYKGIVFTPGLRLDISDPNSDYRTTYYTFTPISSDSNFAKAKTKVTISPRIAVAYPITQNSNIKLNYGLYYQMPDFQKFYDGYNTDLLRSGNIIGNPNMKAQRSNQYNITYEMQSEDNMYTMTISAYYNDKYNVIGSKYIKAIPTPFYQYTLSEYGNQRGLEFSLNKGATPRDHFGFFFNYTLSNSIATSWEAEANASLYGADPYTNKAQFAIVELTQPWDRTHRINGSFDLVWFRDQGPMLFDYRILENVRVNLSGFFQTGTPYTKRNLSGRIVGELLSERQPSRWNVDLRFTKGFNLEGWFNVKATFEIFADVTNLLNNRTYAAVYSVTGDPDNNGSFLKTTPANAVGTETYYRSAYYGNAATFAATQYDQVGGRLYNDVVDYDHNGLITTEERYKSYIRYLEDQLSFRGNYIYPRMVAVGFMVRF